VKAATKSSRRREVNSISVRNYFDFFVPNTRYDDYYHRHEFYHYYLGSKYFNEIGYDRLYTCTAIAEVEAGRRREIERASIRDLGGTNQVVPMAATFVLSDPDRCKRHFSPERWAAFKADVEWFYSVSRGDYWDKMKQDHGYNPPPVWTMTGRLLASLAPAGDHFFKLLASIDVLLQLGAVLLIGWAFGLRQMAIATVFWGCNAPASFTWTCGAFLRQDWYFSFVAALCLARKRHFALSGAALTWSTALRIFPVLAFSGVTIVMLLDVLKKRRLRRDYLRFILGSALAASLLFGASCAADGVDAYRAFAAHIGLHKDTPLTNNMGLGAEPCARARLSGAGSGEPGARDALLLVRRSARGAELAILCVCAEHAVCPVAACRQRRFQSARALRAAMAPMRHERCVADPKRK
jgi:hypothetical protein